MKTVFRTLERSVAAALMCTLFSGTVAAVDLADQPVFATQDVPGNLALALSVEFPTAISVANLGNYDETKEYLGYFDPTKCYEYNRHPGQPERSYFESSSVATDHRCNGEWSGNFMNWATMQTIDPFRWALSGGYRSTDTPALTVLEKAWSSGQGGDGNFPRRGTGANNGHKLDSSLVATVTPFTTGSINTRVLGRGNRMIFGSSGNEYNTLATAPDYNGETSGTYQVYVRVRVCDRNASGGLEANCVSYTTGDKPEGLLQKYANKIRYSAFSYLNGSGYANQGGVMRAQMGFIGPTQPVPQSDATTPNPRGEWSALTGIMVENPDTVSATLNGVTNSGVLNYLNKFGQSSRSYMTYDTVSELYYSAIRYFQNLGNVPEWTASVAPGVAGRDARLDGFPAIENWSGKDPIQYSCQRNFILGIGDNNTHYDRNVGGSQLSNSGRPMPPLVAADTQNKAHQWTLALEGLEGLNRGGSYGSTPGSEYIAGLAYGANVLDIRPDIDGKQTVQTFWMDVMEYQAAKDKNQYWLAAKYGGFTVPPNYDITSTEPLTLDMWNVGNETINMQGQTRHRPENYFLAGDARQMVDGLNTAFSKIANSIRAFTTAFSLSGVQVTSVGATSYSSQYDSENWTGVLSAGSVTFDSEGTPTSTVAWTTSTTLEAQLEGDGWDTDRRVVTWNTSSNSGVPFRLGSLSSAQKNALDTSFVSGNDSADYLNYLRGDRTNEVASSASGSRRAYRNRTLRLGDIVNSKVTAVAAPSMIFAESLNPGYAAFKTAKANRLPMVYAGANDGMVHGFNGRLTGSGAGREVFAYVPSATFKGPSGNPSTDGLAILGNPGYGHKYLVDATAVAYDIDLGNAGGTTGAPNWRTVLIGGLGKGGRSYYAIDVTDPDTMTSEGTIASRVLWEFSHPKMGFSFGAPTVVKTKKYGWVVILASGYDNADNKGHLFIVHPRTGALLEDIVTTGLARGMAHAAAYVTDYTDGTADAVYAGDLDGQLWRFDLTRTSGAYPAPRRIALLKTEGGAAQPVTTAPLIEVQPRSKKRFVMLGTGKLLGTTDISTSQPQTFYAIIDGTASAFDDTISSSIERTDLAALTDLTTGANLTEDDRGWYLELGVTSGVGWRLVTNPSANAGVVAFAPLLPVGDACNPTGASRIYSIDFGSGKTALTSGESYQDVGVSQGTVIDIRFVSVDGKARLLSGTNQGEIFKVDFRPAVTLGLRMINWREVPTAD